MSDTHCVGDLCRWNESRRCYGNGLTIRYRTDVGLSCLTPAGTIHPPARLEFGLAIDAHRLAALDDADSLRTLSKRGPLGDSRSGFF